MDFSKQKDIEKLIKGCLKADKNCQNLLYKSLYSRMMSVCLRYSEDSMQAKDIFQEAMLKVFKNLENYNYQGVFEAWARRIFVNHAIDYIRRNKKYFQDFKDNTLYENIEDEAIVLFDDEEIPDIDTNVILNYIQELSPAYRTVFNMYIIEDYTHKQIAEKLNISIGTSKSNLAKAKVQLRNLLKKELVKIGK